MTRPFFFLALMLMPLSSWADDLVWCMLTDGGSQVELSRVAFLLTADDEDTFSIVCQDGCVYSPVSSISFEQAAASAISAPRAGEQVELSLEARSLTLSGCKQGSHASIHSADGRQLFRASLSEGSNTLSVAHLSPGVYILKAAGTSVKFIKK